MTIITRLKTFLLCILLFVAVSSKASASASGRNLLSADGLRYESFALQDKSNVENSEEEKRYLGLKMRDIIICGLFVGGYLFVRRSISTRKSDF